MPLFREYEGTEEVLINTVTESNWNILQCEENSFFKQKNKEKNNFSHSLILMMEMGVGRAKANCNEENDLNGGMVGSCLQVYRNEIKLGLSIAKQ